MDNFFVKRFRSAEPLGKATVADPGKTQAKGVSFADNAVQVNSPTAALNVAAFYRGVELRARTVSMLKMEYQKLDRMGKNYVQYDRAEGKRINYMLQVQPNPTMTWPVMMMQAEILRIMQGNAVIYVERGIDGEISAFWLCQQASLNTITMQYEIAYNSIRGVVSKSEVPATDVIHIKNTFSNNNGLTGVSTLAYARRTLSIAATNDKLTQENAAKGGRLKLLVQEDNKGGFGLSKNNRKELKQAKDELNQDVYKEDVVLLTNALGVTPISMNAQDMQLLSTRAFSVAEIARLLSVPRNLLMDDSNSSYKTPEAATQEFLARTISPSVTEWEAEMNAKLLGVEGYGSLRYHLCELSLTRLDPMGQATLNEKMLQIGAKTVNEIRQEYDLPAVKEGDRSYISTNLAELGSDKLSNANTGGRPVEQTKEGGNS